MTISILDRRCNSPEEAKAVALGRCISEKGDYCLAYDGVDCKNCEKLLDGLRRRELAFEREKEQTIAEKTFVSGKSARVRKDGSYFRIQFGYRPGNALKIFVVERYITVTTDEKEFLKEVFCSGQI
jgi:hypothetical protein